MDGGTICALTQTIVYIESNTWLVRRNYYKDSMLKKQLGKKWEEWSSLSILLFELYGPLDDKIHYLTKVKL